LDRYGDWLFIVKEKPGQLGRGWLRQRIASGPLAM